jgi:hypothetical protein
MFDKRFNQSRFLHGLDKNLGFRVCFGQFEISAVVVVPYFQTPPGGRSGPLGRRVLKIQQQLKSKHLYILL